MYEINTAWTSSHRQTTRPCPFGKQSHTGVSHRRVPTEPKFSPIRKRPILRALRHSKAYLNTRGGT
ncbi:ALG-2 interacting X [Gossypium arboreum]|uniref:ALG-2 interacting X n=1 Tax=Gossypium arboreum TaxID=29729 RepID=A0A0B0MYR2_GOSAR|nr:ALG-2 interacting X [Gossypium arboreum]